MEITLEMLLKSRDKRWKQIKHLCNNNTHTIMCLTVVMPGTIKRNLHSLIASQAALCEIINTFGDHIVKSEVKDLSTGFEGYFIVDLSPVEAKKMACKIEDSHPLGRLFDIDVFDNNAMPLSRTELGFNPRQCIVCDNEARFCMRNHTHTQQEIHSVINQMVNEYAQ